MNEKSAAAMAIEKVLEQNAIILRINEMVVGLACNATITFTLGASTQPTDEEIERMIGKVKK